MCVSVFLCVLAYLLLYLILFSFINLQVKDKFCALLLCNYDLEVVSRYYVNIKCYVCFTIYFEKYHCIEKHQQRMQVIKWFNINACPLTKHSKFFINSLKWCLACM